MGAPGRDLRRGCSLLLLLLSAAVSACPLREKPLSTRVGMGIPKHDSEGRVTTVVRGHARRAHDVLPAADARSCPPRLCCM